VTNSTARDNGQNGLEVVNTSVARLTVDNSRFENNGIDGLVLTDITATVTRSLASGNRQIGYAAQGASAQITVDSSTARGQSSAGLIVVSATARVSNSVFTDNGFGIGNSGGTVLTRQNNTVSGNTIQDLVGALTPLGGV
jgi:hypothetical protein